MCRAEPTGDAVADLPSSSGIGVRAARRCPSVIRLAAARAANEQLENLINGTREVFVSHSRLGDRFALGIATDHLKTTDRHIRRVCDFLTERADAIAASRDQVRP